MFLYFSNIYYIYIHIYIFFSKYFVYIFFMYIYIYLSLLILTWIVFTNVKVLPYHVVCCCCRFLWAPWMVEDTAKTFVSSILRSAYLTRSKKKHREVGGNLFSGDLKSWEKNCWKAMKAMKAMKRWTQHLRLWEHQTERSRTPLACFVASFCCHRIFFVHRKRFMATHPKAMRSRNPSVPSGWGTWSALKGCLIVDFRCFLRN